MEGNAEWLSKKRNYKVLNIAVGDILVINYL